jgi:hypothetical protein
MVIFQLPSNRCRLMILRSTSTKFPSIQILFHAHTMTRSPETLTSVYIVFTLIGKTRAVFSKWQTLPNVSLETICLHPPDPCMADVHGIGSACAKYQRVFIESRVWRNASRAKEQHAADISRWWLKGCFCLSSLRTTYTALFITFDSDLE